MESNVCERQGSEQCQDKGNETMGESGDLSRAQKGELPGFIGARANISCSGRATLGAPWRLKSGCLGQILSVPCDDRR